MTTTTSIRDLLCHSTLAKPFRSIYPHNAPSENCNLSFLSKDRTLATFCIVHVRTNTDAFLDMSMYNDIAVWASLSISWLDYTFMRVKRKHGTVTGTVTADKMSARRRVRWR